MSVRAWVAVLLVGCASSPPKDVERPRLVERERDVDREACTKLCAEEKRCGADVTECAKTCAEDGARMKRGFVARYVECFLPELRASCPADEARSRAHDRCFDVALAPFPRDVDNQRDMAEAVCERGLRCQGLGTLGRDMCMQATLNPKEPEVVLGQRLVDGLRRERVVAFRKCVDAAPCAKLDAPDRTVDDCYAKTIVGAP